MWPTEFVENGIAVGVSADVAAGERITGRRRVMLGATLMVRLKSELQRKGEVRIWSNMKNDGIKMKKAEVDLRRPNWNLDRAPKATAKRNLERYRLRIRELWLYARPLEYDCLGWDC